jgi:hypothetical protein
MRKTAKFWRNTGNHERIIGSTLVFLVHKSKFWRLTDGTVIIRRLFDRTLLAGAPHNHVFRGFLTREMP